ncbi:MULTISPECIES: hypothetical protein [Pseudomonas]|jgi:hypothetical protein|uniref:hypothetical protein n=1 Tax=Pseudomonas TaxID=286 RepID=UPI000427161B|nr:MULTISPECIES: hypothetical protein [Pseudomonas]MBF8007763.1 hypothetical protein [Pseudomonas brenneri]WJM94283.1 hypothetical protein QDY63_25785 [Pseudomonas brenneri]
MTALGEQGFDICLQAGATTGIMAGETEDNRARAVDIHGARAYHQTLFAWLSGSACILLRNIKKSGYRPLFISGSYRSESPGLEPFKKLFQWCLLAFTGYARVDPNNLMYRRCTSSQKEWGAFDITGQATLGLYALFADVSLVRAADAGRRRRVQ